MRLSLSAAFALQASILVFFLAASSAPTPLYALYQEQWGFSPIAVTAVFAVYALVVLATLLVVGSLSDTVGRRPVLLASLVAHLAAMAVLASAGGVVGLVVGRVLQGIATGMAAGTVGAGLLDIDRARGAVASAVGPMIGTATGGVVSGVVVEFLPAPTTTIYVLLGLVFLAQLLGVLVMPETARTRPWATSTLRPKLALPSTLRPAFLLSAPLIAAAWALPGFHASLGPRLVGSIAGSESRLLGGLSLFVFAASGAVFAFSTRSGAPGRVMRAGGALLVAGTAVVLAAVDGGSLPLFFVGAVVSGAGFGGAFPGGLRSIVALASPTERAGVLSAVYVVCYLAMGVPAVGAGVAVVYGGGLLRATWLFGGAVIVVAALSLALSLAGHRRAAAR